MATNPTGMPWLLWCHRGERGGEEWGWEVRIFQEEEIENETHI
jgi:hypothetical protein